ncbi:MAG: hypothetical protein EXS30_10655 [Pedosphaera sp.]|nr:hypothetical protein [Pedosphaera sp.]
MSDYVTIAEASRVPLDRGLTVRIGEREFALFNIDGDFHVLDGHCSHRGGPLGEGILENGRIYCPLHGWGFDAKTGACFENPERPVKCYLTRVVDGSVQIKL